MFCRIACRRNRCIRTSRRGDQASHRAPFDPSVVVLCVLPQHNRHPLLLPPGLPSLGHRSVFQPRNLPGRNAVRTRSLSFPPLPRRECFPLSIPIRRGRVGSSPVGTQSDASDTAAMAMAKCCTTWRVSRPSRRRATRTRNIQLARSAAKAPWSCDAEVVLEAWNTNVGKGLDSDEARRRMETFGANELTPEPKDPLWKLFLDEFDDLLVRILLAAAAVDTALAYSEGENSYTEPLVILLILFLNAGIGVYQKQKAEDALEALQTLQTATARVVRSGELISKLPARELVPGDVVRLTVGERVPADCRLVELDTATMVVEQSALTGESDGVEKDVKPVEEDADIVGKECMLFASTAVVKGSGTAVVTATGMDTEIGNIQAAISRAGKEEVVTPLQESLNQFGTVLAQGIGVVCLLVWLINYKYFVMFQDGAVSFDFDNAIYYFKVAIALAVAAIPEGLPAVITTSLALGTGRMAEKNAIIRNLPSVETLGCTNVICSDKTGTLTTNQMSASHVYVVESNRGLKKIDVTGSSYDPADGRVLLDPSEMIHLLNLRALAGVANSCNEAQIEYKDGKFSAIGTSTEAALKILAEKIGAPGTDLQRQMQKSKEQSPSELVACSFLSSKLQQKAILEFDRDRKSMSVLCEGVLPGLFMSNSEGVVTPILNEPQEDKGPLNEADQSGSTLDAPWSHYLLAKGAPDGLVPRCSRGLLPDGSVVPLTETLREEISKALVEMSAEGLRNIALAVRVDGLEDLVGYNGSQDHPASKMLMDQENYAAIESEMVFLGVVGIKDPPRAEVAAAVKDCQSAGIRLFVITGDNKLTAESICRSINVFDPTEDLEGKSIVGRDFMSLNEEDRLSFVSGTGSRVFSRAEPVHKQEIVKLLQKSGNVVAMTGDGVNDAPALKMADIGVAMGISGTEVAKGAADMVLADDNFSTIVAAVAEGRAIYQNMQSFIRYLISSNIGEVLGIFITSGLGMPSMFSPVQLLWVNLVTDGPPATALSFNPAEPGLMKLKPRQRSDPFVNKKTLARYLAVGGYMGFACAFVFVGWYVWPNNPLFLSGLQHDGHSTVTFYEITNWAKCSSSLSVDGRWADFAGGQYVDGTGKLYDYTGPMACSYLEEGRAKASTLALSVLVCSELFNSFNALSERSSILTVKPWSNKWLLASVLGALGLHLSILYIPPLTRIFGTVPLNWHEWITVLALSAPIILVEEGMKLLVRKKD
eukprot:scaffold1440_cov332-Pavlova_lutheri.AAC.9